jgi:hypothetical protein
MIRSSVGELTRLHFSVFQEDGITHYSGLLDGDFDKQVIRENAVSGVSGVVSEIGTTGIYVFEFTPNAEGRWYVEVISADAEDVFFSIIDVGPVNEPLGYVVNEAQMNVAHDESITTMYMEVWLDRNGQSIGASDLISCSVSVFDDAGTLLFTEASATPETNGRFSLQRSGVVLNPDRAYNANVTVTDSHGSVVTFQAFTTIG